MGAGAAGIVVAVLAWLRGRAAAAASVRSAEAADRSADAAAWSAQEAASSAELLRAERHEALRPPPPAEIRAEPHEGALVGVITVPRDYRVIAAGYTSNGTWHPVAVPPLLRGNRPTRFRIDAWPENTGGPRTQEIEFRFWPPAGDDEAEHWNCACGKPTAAGDDVDGHWSWPRVPLHLSAFALHTPDPR